MISYMPLQRLLKNKGVTLHDFINESGSLSNLGYCNTKKVYIRTSTLDEICKKLNCRVEDVIRVENNESALQERVVYLENDVSFEPMFKLIKDKGLSMKSVSLGSGIASNTIQMIKSRGLKAKPKYATVRRIAHFLEVKPTDLYQLSSES